MTGGEERTHPRESRAKTEAGMFPREALGCLGSMEAQVRRGATTARNGPRQNVVSKAVCAPLALHLHLHAGPCPLSLQQLAEQPSGPHQL